MRVVFADIIVVKSNRQLQSFVCREARLLFSRVYATRTDKKSDMKGNDMRKKMKTK